jgi:hypothetical protein
MKSPWSLDLAGDRWVPFIQSLSFVGADWTGAAFAMHVRATRDVTGTPLVNLTTVTSASAEGVRLIYGGSDTIANHIAAGRLEEVPAGFEASDTVALSQVGIRVNETTMEGLLFPGSGAVGERGDDSKFYYDLHVTPSGGNKDVYARGTFTARAGATQ